MSGPDALMAVAALQRCLERRDFAGAARLVTLQAVRDGLGDLTAHAGGLWEAEAALAYRASVAAWRVEHEATLRRMAAPEPVSAEQAAENRRVLREALRESDRYGSRWAA